MTATHCNTLQDTSTQGNTLRHCHTLQDAGEGSLKTAEERCNNKPVQRNCDMLQHTATHCNTLQHTATHRKRESRARKGEISADFKEKTSYDRYGEISLEKERYLIARYRTGEISDCKRAIERRDIRISCTLTVTHSWGISECNPTL